MDPRTPRYELIAENDGRVRLAEGRRINGPVVEGHLRNLSANGALIMLRESQARLRFIDEGEMIKMELALPDRGRFAFFATVVRLDPSSQDGYWELGVQFRNLPSDLIRIIDNSVTPRTTDYSHPLNYEYAVKRGFEAARPRMKWAKWRSSARIVATNPRFWLVCAALIAASILSVLL